jgi:hypothetical protein
MARVLAVLRWFWRHPWVSTFGAAALTAWLAPDLLRQGLHSLLSFLLSSILGMFGCVRDAAVDAALEHQNPLREAGSAILTAVIVFGLLRGLWRWFWRKPKKK